MSKGLPPVLLRVLDLWNGGDVDPEDVYVGGCTVDGGVTAFDPEDVLPEIAATPNGKPFTLQGIEVFEVSDDRIVDVWQTWDMGPLYAALGARL
jgi:hypothetical protein